MNIFSHHSLTVLCHTPFQPHPLCSSHSASHPRSIPVVPAGCKLLSSKRAPDGRYAADAPDSQLVVHDLFNVRHGTALAQDLGLQTDDTIRAGWAVHGRLATSMMTTAATDFYYSPPFLRPVVNKFARTGLVRIWKTGSREGREGEGGEEPKSIELNPFIPIPGGRGARAFFPRPPVGFYYSPPCLINHPPTDGPVHLLVGGSREVFIIPPFILITPDG